MWADMPLDFTCNMLLQIRTSVISALLLVLAQSHDPNPAQCWVHYSKIHISISTFGPPRLFEKLKRSLCASVWSDVPSSSELAVLFTCFIPSRPEEDEHCDLYLGFLFLLPRSLALLRFLSALLISDMYFNLRHRLGCLYPAFLLPPPKKHSSDGCQSCLHRRTKDTKRDL